MTLSNDGPSYREIFRLAWPAILANAALPLLGLVDTALLCQVGNTADLGAVALGAFIFNALYWALSFLRMSTTAFVAQAGGAGDEALARVTLQRALVLACVLGLVLLASVLPFSRGIVSLFQPDSSVASASTDYVRARIWGAPATLIVYGVSGALVGRGRTRELLALQLWMVATNLLANLIFVLGIGGNLAGARGLGAGTACGDWLAAGVGLLLVKQDWLPALKRQSARWASVGRDEIGLGNSGFSNALFGKGALLDPSALHSLFAVNIELFFRSLALLTGFFWFSRQGARFGSEVLAANHVLQQLIAVSAFFLDGIAYVSESFVGRAVGARDQRLYNTSFRRTTVSALLLGGALALLVFWLGAPLILLLGPAPKVAAIALDYLPFAAVYIFVGVPAWQFDGVFIGAALAVVQRSAALISVAVFLISAVWLSDSFGNTGLWWAMLIFIATRGFTLYLSLPRIRNLLALR